ncbi:MAG: Rpn family recombination-promoting nuclease/putative transposase [Candidatus Arsenophonus phytopathogenicus]
MNIQRIYIACLFIIIQSDASEHWKYRMTKKFTPTPHDSISKQFLSEKETAKDFFDIWLPDKLMA